MPMLGSAFGTGYFSSPLGGIRNIKKVELSNAIFDELELIESSDIPLTNVRGTWTPSHRILARFLNNLEGGNLQNEGIKVESFVIKRRKVNEINDLVVGYQPFENNKKFVHLDLTQPNDRFIYTVTPVGENGIEGQPNSTEIESDFVGYFLVDAETDQVFPFDKAIGDVGEVDKSQNKGRIQIDTFSQFPRFVYTNQRYTTFSLSTVLIPQDGERSNAIYERLRYVIDQNKPLLVKGSNGSIFICEASNLRDSSPQNTWKGYDFTTVTLDFTEIMTVEDYMEQVVTNEN